VHACLRAHACLYVPKTLMVYVSIFNLLFPLYRLNNPCSPSAVCERAYSFRHTFTLDSDSMEFSVRKHSLLWCQFISN